MPAPPDRFDGQADDGVASLFAAGRASMLRMASLMVGSGALAEEVVQDAFVAVRARWSSLERPGAYLRTTVANGCAQLLRRRDAESRALSSLAPVADVELPARLVELRDALDRLSAQQRIVVVLRYFVDIPDQEIAVILGVRPSTVRSLARRAFALLRKELE
ncbi:MAG: sigma-70 family RNA polymerase sigma factor [Actinomycetota bacterium]|nr:sigma-70 family RNA polymerase sigma factor [Actinomycetota bacterium]